MEGNEEGALASLRQGRDHEPLLIAEVLEAVLLRVLEHLKADIGLFVLDLCLEFRIKRVDRWCRRDIELLESALGADKVEFHA